MSKDSKLLDVDLTKVESATLRRLIEEVRQDELESYYTDEHGNLITDSPAFLYNRMHNRHNRGYPGRPGGYNRMHNRHNRSR